MKHLVLSVVLFITSCSFSDDYSSAENLGTLSVRTDIADATGQNPLGEKALKDKLIATLFDSKDEVVNSWGNLNQLPAKISLPEGSYYLVIESNKSSDLAPNAITYYAKTNLIQITPGNNQAIGLTFEDHLTPPSSGDLFSSTEPFENSIF